MGEVILKWDAVNSAIAQFCNCAKCGSGERLSKWFLFDIPAKYKNQFLQVLSIEESAVALPGILRPFHTHYLPAFRTGVSNSERGAHRVV